MADSLCVCGHRVEDHAEGYEGSFPCGVYEPGGPRDPSGGTLGQLCGCNYFTPPPPRAMVTGGALLRMEASPEACRTCKGRGEIVYTEIDTYYGPREYGLCPDCFPAAPTDDAPSSLEDFFG